VDGVSIFLLSMDVYLFALPAHSQLLAEGRGLRQRFEAHGFRLVDDQLVRELSELVSDGYKSTGNSVTGRLMELIDNSVLVKDRFFLFDEDDAVVGSALNLNSFKRALELT